MTAPNKTGRQELNSLIIFDAGLNQDPGVALLDPDRHPASSQKSTFLYSFRRERVLHECCPMGTETALGSVGHLGLEIFMECPVATTGAELSVSQLGRI